LLPFLLKSKPQTGVIVKTRTPDETSEDTPEDDGMEMIGRDLCHAIESKNYKAIGEALRAAFEIYESQPHEEGEHTEPHSYDSQGE
jgi:hypothetical protein